MSGERPLESFKKNNRLAHALEDAMYLIEHASLTGVTLTDEILAPILDMKSFVLNQAEEAADDEVRFMKAPNWESESKFWEAMSKLSAKFPEVSATSLKSIKKKKEENFGFIRRTIRSWNLNIIPKRPAVSDAKRVASTYRYGAVMWLMLLIVGQIYWIIGKDLYNECRTDIPGAIRAVKYSVDSLEALKFKEYSMQYVASDIAQRLKDKTGVYTGIEKLVEKRTNAGDAEGETLEDIIRQLETNTLDNALSTIVHSIRKKYVDHDLFDNHPEYRDDFVRIEQLNDNLRFAFAQLGIWANPKEVINGNGNAADHYSEIGEQPTKEANDTTGASANSFQRWKAAVQKENFKEKSTLTRSRIILNSLSQFIFPLLFGLIGAYLFVLRSILDSVKQLTFMNGDVISYRVRLVLGSLSGLAIGFFFGETDSGAPFTISNLSPLTLAFLAGYSVDLLFTAMDTLIKRLGGMQGNVVPPK